MHRAGAAVLAEIESASYGNGSVQRRELVGPFGKRLEHLIMFKPLPWQSAEFSLAVPVRQNKNGRTLEMKMGHSEHCRCSSRTNAG
jgi:hypothetical protein